LIVSRFERLRRHGRCLSDPQIRWYRDSTSAAFVEFLTTIAAENSAVALATPETRQALIDPTGLAVSRQLSAALTLQDRLGSLL
jgi:hypothetical protein